MATYNEVDASREQAMKAKAFDEMKAQSGQNQAARQGLKFGQEQGYQQGMQDNDATSMQAYAQGAQAGAGSAYENMINGSGENIVVDGPEVDPNAMSPQEELSQYGAWLNEQVQTEQIGPEEANGMMIKKREQLGIVDSRQQQQTSAQPQVGSGGLGSVNTDLTQRAAQYSMA